MMLNNLSKKQGYDKGEFPAASIGASNNIERGSIHPISAQSSSVPTSIMHSINYSKGNNGGRCYKYYRSIYISFTLRILLIMND